MVVLRRCLLGVGSVRTLGSAVGPLVASFFHFSMGRDCCFRAVSLQYFGWARSCPVGFAGRFIVLVFVGCMLSVRVLG